MQERITNKNNNGNYEKFKKELIINHLKENGLTAENLVIVKNKNFFFKDFEKFKFSNNEQKSNAYILEIHTYAWDAILNSAKKDFCANEQKQEQSLFEYATERFNRYIATTNSAQKKFCANNEQKQEPNAFEYATEQFNRYTATSTEQMATPDNLCYVKLCFIRLLCYFTLRLKKILIERVILSRNVNFQKNLNISPTLTIRVKVFKLKRERAPVLVRVHVCVLRFSAFNIFGVLFC